MNLQSDDARWMRYALLLASRGLGETWPNPTVGAVLVKNGEVLATGRTGKGGRPHAETVALETAGERSRGATLYVSLEPCAHHGKTPPCTDAIIAAGVARVVVGCGDPDPRVNGKGAALLREAGIEVAENVCREEAEALNDGFFSRLRHGRPLVNLKIATSLDGRISFARSQTHQEAKTGAVTHAPRQEKHPWITGEEARACGHALRAQHDAVLTGIGTALADDPRLTCRLPGLEERSPIRIVVDSDLALPASSHLASTARAFPTWILTTSHNKDAAAALEQCGVRIFRLAEKDGKVDIAEGLKLLAAEGLTRVLAEAGSNLSGALLRARAVQTLYWFRAPLVIGNGGIPAIGDELTGELAAWKCTESQRLGADRLEVYQCSPG